MAGDDVRVGYVAEVEGAAVVGRERVVVYGVEVVNQAYAVDGEAAFVYFLEDFQYFIAYFVGYDQVADLVVSIEIYMGNGEVCEEVGGEWGVVSECESGYKFYYMIR